MSQFSVPWTPRPEPHHGPLAALVVRLARLVYAVGKPIVTRFPGPLLIAAVVAVCLLVWGVRLTFDYVDGVLAAPGIVLSETQPPGAPLAAADLVRALQARETAGWLAYLLWPVQFTITRDLVAVLGILGFVSIAAAFCTWWERKVAGRIQSRMAPMRVGGWHGWAQSPADGIKVIAKEDLVPAEADGVLFRLAPYLAFVPPVAAFLALPFGTYYVCRNLDVGLLFILAMLGLEVFGVLLAGWASNNKWSLYGAMREACQIVSYESPMGMVLLIPIMCAGTLSLAAIGDLQDGGWFNWLAFRSPFTFLAAGAYFVASLASVGRAPFDLPEAESELVGGFHTEYSGFRWVLFFFGEYAAMFVVSGLLTILFLGAWHSPLPVSWAPEGSGVGARLVRGVVFGGPLWFVAKCTFLIYVQMWLRWTLPRIRIDQVLYACIQVLLPGVMILLLANTLWELGASQGSAVFDGIRAVLRYVFGGIGLLMVAAFVVVMLYGRFNRDRLVGTQAVRDPLAGG